MSQLGERVFQRELVGLAGDEMKQLPMKPHRARRTQTVAASERPLRLLSVPRGIAADELQGAMGFHGENRAGISAREGMSVPVGRARVEQQDMVGIGKHGLALLCAPKHTPAHEHDAVRRIRLFGALGRDMGPTTEIDHRDAERLEQHRPRVRHVGLFTRKNLQAGGVHSRDTIQRRGAPLESGRARNL